MARFAARRVRARSATTARTTQSNAPSASLGTVTMRFARDCTGCWGSVLIRLPNQHQYRRQPLFGSAPPMHCGTSSAAPKPRPSPPCLAQASLAWSRIDRDHLPPPIRPHRRRINIHRSSAIAGRQCIEPFRPPEIDRHCSPFLEADTKFQLRLFVSRLRTHGEALEFGISGTDCERNTSIGISRAASK
jgi:hypothetical protein